MIPRCVVRLRSSSVIRVVACMLVACALLARTPNTVSGQGCTPPMNCPTANLHRLQITADSRMPINRAQLVVITSTVDNPQCPIPQATVPTKITHVIRLTGIDNLLEFKPASEQRDFRYLAQARITVQGVTITRSQVRLLWIAIPRDIGYVRFLIDVEVFLDDCRIVHESQPFEIIVVNVLGMDPNVDVVLRWLLVVPVAGVMRFLKLDSLAQEFVQRLFHLHERAAPAAKHPNNRQNNTMQTRHKSSKK